MPWTRAGIFKTMLGFPDPAKPAHRTVDSKAHHIRVRNCKHPAISESGFAGFPRGRLARWP